MVSALIPSLRFGVTVGTDHEAAHFAVINMQEC